MHPHRRCGPPRLLLCGALFLVGIRILHAAPTDALDRSAAATAGPTQQAIGWPGNIDRASTNHAVLFNGIDLAGWQRPHGTWTVAAGVTLDPSNPGSLRTTAGLGTLVNHPDGKTVDLVSEAVFGDVELHVEFCIPRHSNSGVYLQGRYEVQVYDSFGVAKDAYPGIECGGIYPRWIDESNVDGHSPLVNASKPPGEWQSFDILFRAPTFDARHRKQSNARFVRVVHNGQVIHENVEVQGPTRSARWPDEQPFGPILLQGDHGPVAFRNLRVRLDPFGVTRPQAANPILPGADPHAAVFGTTVWIYPTWSDSKLERFFAFSSTNLTVWERHGPVLEFKDVAWIKDDGQAQHRAWAPCVLEKNGRFHFYYSVGPQNPTPSRIGVAVGTRPEGPFIDSGKPLLTGGNGFEAIDPMAFTDPKSGTSYLYAGGSAGARLRVFELSPNMVGFAREIPVETPPLFTEGVFMHERNGRYYLSYSHGGWQSASYSVHYATSDTPVGPWTYRSAILTSDATRKGPGHHAFFQNPESGGWLIAYHRWEGQTGDGPYRGSRQICIERVDYDPDGRIRPVIMTGGAGAGY